MGYRGEALLWGMKYKLEPEGLIISAPPSYQPWMTSRGAGVCKQLFTLTWPRLEAESNEKWNCLRGGGPFPKILNLKSVTSYIYDDDNLVSLTIVQFLGPA